MTLVEVEPGRQLVLSICKDHRLRIWDLKNRSCTIAFGLLEFIPSSDFEDSDVTAEKSLYTDFAPGMYHRISIHKIRPDNVGVLVYLSLSRASASLGSTRGDSLGITSNALDGSTNGYWVWLQIDTEKMLQRERDNIRVVSVDPVVDPPTRRPYSFLSASAGTDAPPCTGFMGQSSPNPPKEVHVMDLLPVEVDSSICWNDDPLQVGSCEPGVWWLANNATSQPSGGLDDLYRVRWSGAHGPSSTVVGMESDISDAVRTSQVIQHNSALPPGCTPTDSVPDWRQQPACLLVDGSLALDTSNDSSNGPPSSNDVESFLDHMFQPGRFSWFALASTLKSLRDSHQLPNNNSFGPPESMDELRSQTYGTLYDDFLTKLESDEFFTVLKTFHSTAVDFHEYGLQPLGLLATTQTTGLLRLQSNTCAPYTPGLIVVRRWGFSVICPLERYERLFWNQNPDQPLCVSLDEADMTNPLGAEISCGLSNLVGRTRLLVERLRSLSMWNQWEPVLYGSGSPSNQEWKHSTDLNGLVNSVLDELDVNFLSLEPPTCTDPSDWEEFVFDYDASLTTDTAAMETLIQLLEALPSTSNLDASLSPSFHVAIDAWLEQQTVWRDEGLSSWYSLSTYNDTDLVENLNGTIARPDEASAFGVTLICQAFVRACTTRLHFAFGLLILATRAEKCLAGVGRVDLSVAHLITRFTELIHSLRILRWMGCTRLRCRPDATRMAKLTDHLTLLGLSQPLEPGQTVSTPFIHSTAGITLLEQLTRAGLRHEPCVTADDQCQPPWTLECTRQLDRLYATFSPITNHGQNLSRVLRHLLLGGCSAELLKLADLLGITGVDDQDRGAPQSEDWEDPDALDRTWCWDGDHSALFLCIGLAHLWQNQPEAAEASFIKAAKWLRDFAQRSSARPQAAMTAFIPASKESIPDASQLLLNSLFPAELGSDKLFLECQSMRNGSDQGDVCPSEVQVRFLMKVMPVLELSDCVTQVLNMCELSLNILSHVYLSGDRDDRFDEAESSTGSGDEDTGTRASTVVKSRRLTAILANLHAFQDGGPNEGFLCDPVPDEATLSGSDPNALVYSRLADLEAALWTRMFKHHLALGHYREAHLLIRSNPDTARRRDCLRRLIVTLCDSGEVAQLVSFHYGAAEDEFLIILEARARATDVLPASFPLPADQTAKSQSPSSTANPYYDVLYAFHIRRANYRAAASILFEHAHRIAEETNCSIAQLCGGGFRAGGARLLFGLQRQCAYLVAAINALHLVPEQHQWLVRPGPSMVEEGGGMNEGLSAPMDEQLDQDGMELTDFDALLEDDWAFDDASTTADVLQQPINSMDQPGPSTTRVDLCMTDGTRTTRDDMLATTSPISGRMGEEKQLLRLADLLSLYSLTRARLRLAQVCWEQGMLRAGYTGPTETVQSLLSMALYDEALRVTEQFDLDRTPVVDAVASRCAELAQYTCVHPTGLRPSLLSGGSGGASAISLQAAPRLAGSACPLNHEFDAVSKSFSFLLDTSNPVESGAGAQSDPMVVAMSGTHETSSLSDSYWRLLELILAHVDPPLLGGLECRPTSSTHQHQSPLQASNGGYLHLLASRRLLQSGPHTLHLPEWLISRLVTASTRTCRTVGLLRLYVQYDRVEKAYLLIMDMLDAARGVIADPSAFGVRMSLTAYQPMDAKQKRQAAPSNKLVPQSLWLPHNLIVRLLEGLRRLANDYPACKIMHSNLSKNVTNYFGRLDAFCARVCA